jgi:hypothetical protein
MVLNKKIEASMDEPHQIQSHHKFCFWVFDVLNDERHWSDEQKRLHDVAMSLQFY